MKRILLVGGGTGGHVYPLMAVAQSLKNKALHNGVDLNLLVLGDGKFIEEACPENGLKFKRVLAGKYRRYFSYKNLVDILKLPAGFIQSLWYLFWFMPDAVLAKGGYASFIPALVSKIYFIPLYTHESDSVPGLTTRIIGKWSKKVFVAFKSAEKFYKPGKTELVGNPIRLELFSGNRQEALKFFNIDGTRKIVLILGGSQGAQVVNNIVIDSLYMLLQKYSVIHQCGENNLKAVNDAVSVFIKDKPEYAQMVQDNYRVYPFFNSANLAMAYSLGDVIVSRAGAANIFEIANLARPAIIIPIANSHGDHQLSNAQEFAQNGAVLMEEANLAPHIFLSQIDSLIQNSAVISPKIKSFAMPQAADLIAEQLLA